MYLVPNMYLLDKYQKSGNYSFTNNSDFELYRTGNIFRDTIKINSKRYIMHQLYLPINTVVFCLRHLKLRLTNSTPPSTASSRLFKCTPSNPISLEQMMRLAQMARLEGDLIEPQDLIQTNGASRLGIV